MSAAKRKGARRSRPAPARAEDPNDARTWPPETRASSSDGYSLAVSEVQLTFGEWRQWRRAQEVRVRLEVHGPRSAPLTAESTAAMEIAFTDGGGKPRWIDLTLGQFDALVDALVGLRERARADGLCPLSQLRPLPGARGES